MGIPVLVMGESGSGKTYSLKNFNEGEITVFSVEKSRLPFQKKLPVLPHASYKDISRILGGELHKESYAIDDSQYLLVNEMFDGMDNAENKYTLYQKIALNFRNLVHFINRSLPDNVIVYFLHHTETGADGRIKAKTVGQALDKYLTVEGCFDIVLRAEKDTDGYFFETESDGFSTAKSPEGMFEKRISNDLKAVDVAIRRYYGLETYGNKKTEGE